MVFMRLRWVRCVSNASSFRGADACGSLAERACSEECSHKAGSASGDEHGHEHIAGLCAESAVGCQKAAVLAAIRLGAAHADGKDALAPEVAL